MKSWLFFLITISFALSNISTSQTDIQNYKLPDESNGTRVIFELNGNYGSIKYPYGYSRKIGNLQGILNVSAWKIKGRFDYGIYGSGTGTLNYDESKPDTLPAQIIRYGKINGELLGTADYYLKENKYYASVSYDYTFNGQYVNSTELNAGFSYNQNQYIWFSAGYGKILNASRVIHADNFESVLRKLKVINAPLSPTVKAKLTSLLDKRNNGYYLSKYKDDNDAIFLRDVEKVLNDENAIDGKLGAEAVMLLYRTLSNNKYVYYPRYKGFQVQAEVQIHPMNVVDVNNFLTFSSIYGLPVKSKTDLTASGFISVPLNNSASDFGLFQTTLRNPFSNYFTLIIERQGIESYAGNIYGAGTYFSGMSNLSYVGGIKLCAFHSFSENIGALVYLQGVATKPKETGFRNSILAGGQIDLNILSYMRLSLFMYRTNNNSWSNYFYSGLSSSFILY